MNPFCHENEVTPISEGKLSMNMLGMVLIQQYNLKTGLKMFGDKREKAVTK